MTIPPDWRVFASLGIPGLGLGVFYFLFRDLVDGQNPWLVALAMILIWLIAVIALWRFPRHDSRQRTHDHADSQASRSDDQATINQHSAGDDE